MCWGPACTKQAAFAYMGDSKFLCTTCAPDLMSNRGRKAGDGTVAKLPPGAIAYRYAATSARTKLRAANVSEKLVFKASAEVIKLLRTFAEAHFEEEEDKEETNKATNKKAKDVVKTVVNKYKNM